MEFKKCAVCGEEKPQTAYIKRSGGGRRGTCRACARKRRRAAGAKAGTDARPEPAASVNEAEHAPEPAGGACPEPVERSAPQGEAASGGTGERVKREQGSGDARKRKRKRRRNRRRKTIQAMPVNDDAAVSAASVDAVPAQSNSLYSPELEAWHSEEGCAPMAFAGAGAQDAAAAAAPLDESEPAPKRKRKRKRRRRRSKTHIQSVPAKDRDEEKAQERPPFKRIVAFKGPFTFDTSILNDRGTGLIRLRGRRETGKRWSTEIPAEMAVRMVKEGAAGILGPRIIHKLYTKTDFRILILQRDNYICRYCGRFGDTIDHVLPKSKGGLSTPENCVCACADCNLKKADSLDFVFDDL